MKPIRFKSIPVYFEVVKKPKLKGFNAQVFGCIARYDSGVPVDRFSIFNSGSGFTAWTGDTISIDLKTMRREFSERFNGIPGTYNF